MQLWDEVALVNFLQNSFSYFVSEVDPSIKLQTVILWTRYQMHKSVIFLISIDRQCVRGHCLTGHIFEKKKRFSQELKKGPSQQICRATLFFVAAFAGMQSCMVLGPKIDFVDSLASWKGDEERNLISRLISSPNLLGHGIKRCVVLLRSLALVDRMILINSSGAAFARPLLHSSRVDSPSFPQSL